MAWERNKASQFFFADDACFFVLPFNYCMTDTDFMALKKAKTFISKLDGYKKTPISIQKIALE